MGRGRETAYAIHLHTFAFFKLLGWFDSSGASEMTLWFPCPPGEVDGQRLEVWWGWCFSFLPASLLSLLLRSPLPLPKPRVGFFQNNSPKNSVPMAKNVTSAHTRRTDDMELNRKNKSHFIRENYVVVKINRGWVGGKEWRAPKINIFCRWRLERLHLWAYLKLIHDFPTPFIKEWSWEMLFGYSTTSPTTRENRD